jgi:hypothetical protein
VIVTVTAVPTGAVSFCGGAGGCTSAAADDGAGPCTAGAEAAAASEAGVVPGLAGAAEGFGALAGGAAACGVEPSEFGTWAGCAGGVELLHPPKTRTADRATVAAKDEGFMVIDASGKIAIFHRRIYRIEDHITVKGCKNFKRSV